jgi:hypothetical protein
MVVGSQTLRLALKTSTSPRFYTSAVLAAATTHKMGKNNKRPREFTADESHLLLPNHVTTNGRTPIVDTHTHIELTYATYRRKYGNAQHQDLFSFVRAMYEGKNMEAVVDVWCEAPVHRVWKELADSALTPELRQEKWGGIEYWFVMGEFFIPILHLRNLRSSSMI